MKSRNENEDMNVALSVHDEQNITTAYYHIYTRRRGICGISSHAVPFFGFVYTIFGLDTALIELYHCRYTPLSGTC
jgi:hypothetical protein